MKKLTFDDEYLRLVAMDMACYLSWLEEFEDRTLDPTKMKSLIKKFFQFEKKGGHIKTFNETDINGVAILVYAFDPNKIKKFRKKNGWDKRVNGFKKSLGIKEMKTYKKKTTKEKKKLKKKTKIVSQSKHFKKIANNTYSEYLQHLIDNFDKDFFDTHIEAEIIQLPLSFRALLGDVFHGFGAFIRNYELTGHIDLKTISCKEMYEEIVSYMKMNKYNSFFKKKKWYDNFFFASSYMLASTALDNRDLRKAYGLSKGFFG
jgi:hypothetical protein